VYAGLRQQVLSLTPDQLGEELADEPIFALLMETGYPEAVATLVGVAEGTTSLYFSNGGGFIGAGTHANVAEANRRWHELGRSVLPRLGVIADPPLPDEDMTQFVAVRPRACAEPSRPRRSSAKAGTSCRRSSTRGRM
jgi:hypothetical protein